MKERTASDAAPSPQQDPVLGFSDRFGLSIRERDVLRSLLKGNTLGAIAESDCVSLNTIKTHVNHIYQKTGVHSRDELIALVEKQEGELSRQS